MLTLSYLQASERKGRVKGGQREQGLKKKGWVGELWDNVAHQWAKRGEGLLSRRTEGCWQNHKFHKAERSSGGLCVSWSAVVAGEESVWRCFLCPARSLSNSKRTGRVCVPVLVYGCSGLQWCLCVHVSATTKRLEIYWGDGLWGAMLVRCPSLPSQRPPPVLFPRPESGVFSSFQPPLRCRKETHSGNVDNSAVIAGDL